MMVAVNGDTGWQLHKHKKTHEDINVHITSGVATKNSLVRPREQQIDAQRGMCMCMYFIKTIIIIIIVDIGHLNLLNLFFRYLII